MLNKLQKINENTLNTFIELCFDAIFLRIPELFAQNRSKNMPDIPMFVTAFTSNHYQEGLAQLRNFERFVRPAYQNSPLVVYNIGLTEEENKMVG